MRFAVRQLAFLRFALAGAALLGFVFALILAASPELHEQAHHDGHPLYVSLLRRLRAAGAAGATSLRGIWGYHGDHTPHGDTLWQLRRRVPVVTVVVDTPERTKRWFEIVDEVTADTGLVTSEAVPTSLGPQPPG